MRTTAATWVKFGRELLELDEVYSLAGCMEISQVEAAGYIALLVAFALAHADDDGQIDHLTDKTIETGCYWDGERGELVAAFTSSGVLTGQRDSDSDPLAIAPSVWAALAGKAIAERAAARKRKAEERAREAAERAANRN